MSEKFILNNRKPKSHSSFGMSNRETTNILEYLLNIPIDLAEITCELEEREETLEISI